MNLCISITDVINRLYASVYNYVCGSELNSEFIYISSRPLNLAEIRITCASMKQMVGRVVPKSVSAIPNVNLVRFHFQIVLKVTIQMLIQWKIKRKKSESFSALPNGFKKMESKPTMTQSLRRSWRVRGGITERKIKVQELVSMSVTDHNSQRGFMAPQHTIIGLLR